MLLIVSIIITAELYSTFKYHMKIGETTRCCSFFLRTHVKISSKISIIEFNIQIKWCIIVTPSREAEKDYQGYFNSPPHKKNHIATTMINTVLFKISTHIFTRRMMATCTNTTVSNIISTHIFTKRMTCGFTTSLQSDIHFNSYPHEEDDGLWQDSEDEIKNFNSHPHEEDDRSRHTTRTSNLHFNSHPHEEDDEWNPLSALHLSYFNSHPHEEDDTLNCACCDRQYTFQLTSSRRGWPRETASSLREYVISTHILTKRMTCTASVFAFVPWVISTHILTKRMTGCKNGKNDGKKISTHILTKRMTQTTFRRARRCISTHILTKRMTFSLIFSQCCFIISTHILTKRMTFPS